MLLKSVPFGTPPQWKEFFNKDLLDYFWAKTEDVRISLNMLSKKPSKGVINMDTSNCFLSDDFTIIPLKKEINRCRRELLRFMRRRLLVLEHRGRLQRNRHFREWAQLPMDYWRYLEMPLTLWYMSQGKVKAGQTLLDIGSPKLLALYLSVANPKATLIASDISDYFVSDFQEFKSLLGLDNMQVKILDGRYIEFENETIDQVFSVSVLEHIPDDGDSKCMAEIGRVLKQGGLATITLPYTTSYCEEWLEGIKTYWSNHSIESGEKVFFQRRYAWEEIVRRIIKPSGLRLKSMVLTAESPIKRASKYYYHGKIVENCNYINNYIKKSTMIKIILGIMGSISVLTPYQWVHSYYSRRYLYFTSDKGDEKALNIVLQMEK